MLIFFFSNCPISILQAAFWALASVVEDLVPDYYVTSMKGIRRDSQVFGAYVEKKLPKLHAHFTALQLMYEPLVMNWFLQLFVNTLPFHTTLKVWDLFLHEGVKILFRVGIAVLKVLEEQLLLTKDFGTLYMLLTEGIDLSSGVGSVGSGGSGGSGETKTTDSGSSGGRKEDGRDEGDALIAMAFQDIGSMSTKMLVELRRKVIKKDTTLQ